MGIAVIFKRLRDTHARAREYPVTLMRLSISRYVSDVGEFKVGGAVIIIHNAYVTCYVLLITSAVFYCNQKIPSCNHDT